MPNWVTNNIYLGADADKAHEILNVLKHDEGKFGSFDFNKLIPMPESLNVTSGSITNIAISAYLYQVTQLARENPDFVPEYEQSMLAAMAIKRNLWRGLGLELSMSQKEFRALVERSGKTEEDLFELGRQYLDNQMKYGATTWYDWANEHWGTKWNLDPKESVLDEDDPCVLHLYTAWGAPIPVIEALSKKFPDTSITHEWADEDMGSNVGRITWLNGEQVDSHFPYSGSKEAYDLYFEVNGATPEDYFLRYDEKTGTYVFDEEMEARVYAQSRSLNEKIDDAEERAKEQQADKTATPAIEPSR